MRSMLLLSFLGAMGLTACAASPGPAAGPSGTTEPAMSVAPVQPTATATTTATASETATPDSTKVAQNTTCFSKPVVLSDKRDKSGQKTSRAAQPVPTGLPDKLAACGKEADPEACKVAVGEVYFDANRIEDAGPIFLDVAMNGKTGGAATKAAMLYLECLNVLGREAEPPRMACFDEMVEKVGPLKARHCGAPSKETEKLCPLLMKIEDDLERLKAEELVKKADRSSESERLPLFRQAGDVYMALFNRRCAFQRPDVKKKPVAPAGWTADNRCDEIGYNAMLAYVAAHEVSLAQAARAALINPDNRLDKGALADKARKIEIR